jgi:multidrug transporter EmrE-like cation transporter
MINTITKWECYNSSNFIQFNTLEEAQAYSKVSGLPWREIKIDISEEYVDTTIRPISVNDLTLDQLVTSWHTLDPDIKVSDLDKESIISCNNIIPLLIKAGINNNSPQLEPYAIGKDVGLALNTKGAGLLKSNSFIGTGNRLLQTNATGEITPFTGQYASQQFLQNFDLSIVNPNASIDISLIQPTNAIGSLTFPANTLGASNSIELKMKGIFTRGNSSTLTLRIKLNNTTVTSVSIPTNAVSRAYTVYFSIAVVQIGILGQIRFAGWVDYNDSGNNLLQVWFPSGTFSVNTTVAQSIDLTMNHSNNATGQTYTSKYIQIMKYN